MPTYMLLDSNGYGNQLVGLSESEYNALSDKSKHILVPDNAEPTEYNWRTWNNTLNTWIDDLDKYAELNPSPVIEPGPTPEPPPVVELTFEQKKSIALNSVTMTRLQKQLDGTTWNGYEVVCDSEALTYLNGAVLMANLGQWSGGWKMKDNTLVSLTSAQVLELATAVGAYIQTLFAREAELLAQVGAATDEAGLAFTW